MTVLKIYLPILLALSVLALFILVGVPYFIRKIRTYYGHFAHRLSFQQNQAHQDMQEICLNDAASSYDKGRGPVPDETKSVTRPNDLLAVTGHNVRSFVTISSTDISAIAGDDIFATQLDLARAYIETDRKQLAKKILNFVIQQGSPDQQQEAKKILGLLS